MDQVPLIGVVVDRIALIGVVGNSVFLTGVTVDNAVDRQDKLFVSI